MTLDEMERLFAEYGKQDLFNSVRLVLVTETDWQEWSEDVVKQALQRTFHNSDEFLLWVKRERLIEALSPSLSEKEKKVYAAYLQSKE